MHDELSSRQRLALEKTMKGWQFLTGHASSIKNYIVCAHQFLLTGVDPKRITGVYMDS